ncbi:hypothetical protein U0C82_12285, partial [Fulvimarina sp. 2208YS6-2-32]
NAGSRPNAAHVSLSSRFHNQLVKDHAKPNQRRTTNQTPKGQANPDMSQENTARRLPWQVVSMTLSPKNKNLKARMQPSPLFDKRPDCFQT